MSPLVSPLHVRTPKSGDRGGGVHPPEIGGGGGRDPGDGSPDYDKRLQRARIGLICGVIAVSMIFVMLTVVFFGRQTAVVLDSQTHRYVRRVLTFYAMYRAQQNLPMTQLSVELPKPQPDDIAF